MASLVPLLDPQRVAFLQGLLVAFASAGQIIDFEELRRLCHCDELEFSHYLQAARVPVLVAQQPDFCAVVISATGLPAGFRDLELWDEELVKAHGYWADRRNLTAQEFQQAHGSLPAVPGKL